MRDKRVMGMMFVCGVLTAVLAGHWKYAGPATLVALIIGGFVGEAWHRWRASPPISFQEFNSIRNGGISDGLEAGAKLIEDCAVVADDKAQALRHASLIRQLKPKSRLESSPPRE